MSENKDISNQEMEWRLALPSNTPDHPYYDKEAYSQLIRNRPIARGFWLIELGRDLEQKTKLTPQEILAKFQEYKGKLLKSQGRVANQLIPAFRELALLNIRKTRGETPEERSESARQIKITTKDVEKFTLFDVWADLMWITDDHDGKKFAETFNRPYIPSDRPSLTSSLEQLSAAVEEAMLLPSHKNQIPREFLEYVET